MMPKVLISLLLIMASGLLLAQETVTGVVADGDDLPLTIPLEELQLNPTLLESDPTNNCYR